MVLNFERCCYRGFAVVQLLDLAFDVLHDGILKVVVVNEGGSVQMKKLFVERGVNVQYVARGTLTWSSPREVDSEVVPMKLS